jgi:hypothetical protein
MILFTNSQKPYLLDLNLVREPPLPVIRSISEILMGNLWIILSGFLVLGILLFFVFLSRRKKAEQIVEDKEIEVDPFQEALSQINLLSASSPRLPPKPFVFKLSEIIRLFIERQFKLPALEQTGEEFLREVSQHSFLKKNFEKSLAEFVQKGDRVKYSSDSFESKHLDDLLETARSFVEQTQQELTQERIETKHDSETSQISEPR